MTFHETAALLICIIGGFALGVWILIWWHRPKCDHKAGPATYECRTCHRIVWSDR